MLTVLGLVCFCFNLPCINSRSVPEKNFFDDVIQRSDFLRFLPRHVLRLANIDGIDISEYVTFDLYTRDNPTTNQQILVNNVNRLQNSNINLSKPIKIIIHGWESSNKSEHIQRMKDRYIEMKDYNIILVDWAPLASNPTYVMPVVDTRKVADYISELIDFFVYNGASLERVHLVGHSLGAHISGYVGANFEGNISRITGLDPALPGFLGADPDARLDPTDAKFVDVIHSCAGALGYPLSLGTVDFFPNGGQPGQPGCVEPAEVLALCSHGQAVNYFTESIGDPYAYPSYQCDNWINFQLHFCQQNQIISMGEEVPTNVTGNYYLRTSDKYPYHSSERSNLLRNRIINTYKFEFKPLKFGIRINY